MQAWPGGLASGREGGAGGTVLAAGGEEKPSASENTPRRPGAAWPGPERGAARSRLPDMCVCGCGPFCGRAQRGVRGGLGPWDSVLIPNAPAQRRSPGCRLPRQAAGPGAPAELTPGAAPAGAKAPPHTEARGRLGQREVGAQGPPEPYTPGKRGPAPTATEASTRLPFPCVLPGLGPLLDRVRVTWLGGLRCRWHTEASSF